MVHIRVVRILLIVSDAYANGIGRSRGCHGYLLLIIIIAIDDQYPVPPTLRDQVPSFIVDEFNNILSFASR